MAIRSSAILIPIAAGVAVGFLAPLSLWAEIVTPLITALSVIAAAGLVRLARGIPFTNPDHFTVEEVRNVAEALKSVARGIRLLVIMALLAMALVALSGPVAKFIESVEFVNSIKMVFASFLSGTLGALVSYVGVRMLHVLQGDISLMELQGDVLEKAAARKAAKEEVQRFRSSDGPLFRDPEGYGDMITRQ